MRRITLDPRADWQQAVAELGLLWHSDAEGPYWDESGCYEFTLEQIDRLEDASDAVHQLYVEAGARIVEDERLLAACGIPRHYHAAVRKAWHARVPALDFGRFDFAWDGTGAPKLLEYNCDTPTSLLEASIVQWYWKEAVFPDCDQFNSLHERLIERWQTLSPALPGRRVWFAHVGDEAHEDTMTTTYMRDLAQQAGLETHGLLIEQIGIDAQGRIVDQDDGLITALFKLYPWEWMAVEEFGQAIVPHMTDTVWLEPVWKMMWSNKAVLAVLWEMFPGHENLLPATLDPRMVSGDYVSKPILSREGANVQVVADGAVIASSGGAYATDRLVYQQRYPLKDFGHGYPVLGSWIVGGKAAGLGIREDGLITANGARFVPHVIRG
ncbi:MAG: glutathionylspermidine synthase family protein [Novosphingobium sp.]|nr:glutathionylspermidine synthase family protein [Novosphingobium sp.]